jgi:DNA polymerase-3 subunit gamma/tau
MSYQVIARKWRPRTFDEVVGQQAVTRTLRNALASKRLAQAFVFAGPRGVGKTTTARILARALNCVNGPTPDPCGTCDACVEIAEGRDMDVLEIDAATHTQVENVREVIVSGLSIMPVRNRYKVFIIDEVHQLSGHSFNALLKSIEEPPPHVVFMMATTELEKIPETVRSRSQVYELRTITTMAIAAQLRKIVAAEGITVADESLQLIARDADGSMRDAQSKLDQVIAFTGKTIGIDDVSTVLGLVGRDLLLDAVDAVANDNAAAAFETAGRAVELGYDLRLVCRELSRVVRDLLVLSVDPARIQDPEIAGEGERDRVKALAALFSREDLLRAFDLFAKAEADIKGAAQPRYHLEMALLRWIYLRKLTPIEDLIAGTSRGPAPPPSRPPIAQPRADTAPTRPASQPAPQQPSRREQAPASGASSSSSAPAEVGSKVASQAGPNMAPAQAGALKDSLLAEIRKSKMVFYSTVVAQAQKIDVVPGRVTFTFSANQGALRAMFEQNRGWLESVAEKLAGRKVVVESAQVSAAVLPAESGESKDQAAALPVNRPDRKTVLKEQALADAGVKALLEVFPAEIRDVEEM